MLFYKITYDTAYPLIYLLIQLIIYSKSYHKFIAWNHIIVKAVLQYWAYEWRNSDQESRSPTSIHPSTLHIKVKIKVIFIWRIIYTKSNIYITRRKHNLWYTNSATLLISKYTPPIMLWERHICFPRSLGWWWWSVLWKR